MVLSSSLVRCGKPDHELAFYFHARARLAEIKVVIPYTGAINLERIHDRYHMTAPSDGALDAGVEDITRKEHQAVFRAIRPVGPCLAPREQQLAELRYIDLGLGVRGVVGRCTRLCDVFLRDAIDVVEA